MCAQMDEPASERPKGLSASEAEEMCKSKELKTGEIINEEAEESIAILAKSMMSKVLAQTHLGDDPARAAGIAEPLVNKITNLISTVLQRAVGGEKGQEAAQDKASNIQDKLTTEENLEETGMAAGAVAGFSAPLGGSEDERQRKEA